MDALLFENDDWTVTTAGLEHKWNGYFIAREDVGEKRCDGSWNWPVHLSEKTWAEPRAFAQAFLRALAAYGIKPDADLAPSFPPPHAWASAAHSAAPAGWKLLGDLAGAEVETLRRADPGTDVRARMRSAPQAPAGHEAVAEEAFEPRRAAGGRR
jgi:hypothetical protein